jgi:hypothetical protein
MRASAAERSAPTSLLLLRQPQSAGASLLPPMHSAGVSGRAARARLARGCGSRARVAASGRLSLCQAPSRDAGPWQHPWQHPDRPMCPYRPRFGTIRTIWRDWDGSDSRVTRLRAWSRLTGWRFESSSAHQRRPGYAGLSRPNRRRAAARRDRAARAPGGRPISGAVLSDACRPAQHSGYAPTLAFSSGRTSLRGLFRKSRLATSIASPRSSFLRRSTSVVSSPTAASSAKRSRRSPAR